MSFINLEKHKMCDSYRVVQEKGQLIATLNTGYHPKRGCEVFLNNIPRDLLMQEIYQFMEKAGEIYQIRMMMDFSGFNRGNAYVTYMSMEDARKAIIVLDQEEIRPKWPVVLKMSFDNNRLVMKNIPHTVDHNTILSEISAVIGNGLKDLIMTNPEQPRGQQPPTQTSNRYCILKYETHRHALEARKKVWPGIYLWDTAIDIDWAIPPELAGAKLLFFRNCPENTTKLDFFEVFKPLLDLKEILKFTLDGGRSGSITFSSDKARRRAYFILKDSLIFGRHLQWSFSSFNPAEECFLFDSAYSGTPLMYQPDQTNFQNPIDIENISQASSSTSSNQQLMPFYQPIGDCLSFYPNSPSLPPVDATSSFDWANEYMQIMNETFSVPSSSLVTPSFVESSVYTNLKNVFPSIQTFYPQPQYTAPGLFNELMAIQHSIHSIINFDHPNVTWIFWAPYDQISNYISAVRILPVVNNCCYEFVLLQVLRP